MDGAFAIGSYAMLSLSELSLVSVEPFECLLPDMGVITEAFGDLRKRDPN